MGDLVSRQLHNKSSMFLVELLLSQRKLIITAALAFCWKHRVLICKIKECDSSVIKKMSF